jgi:type II secretory pathway pseudopilin PulG
MKKQNGFTLVEGLLIFIVIGIVGFSVYFVLNNKSNDDQNSNNTGTNSEENATTPEIQDNSVKDALTTQDEIKNWETVDTKEFKYSVPTGWTNAENYYSGYAVLSPGHEAEDPGVYILKNGAEITISIRQTTAKSLDQLVSDANSGAGYETDAQIVKDFAGKPVYRSDCGHTTVGMCYVFDFGGGKFVEVSYRMPQSTGDSYKNSEFFAVYEEYLQNFYSINKDSIQ